MRETNTSDLHEMRKLSSWFSIKNLGIAAAVVFALSIIYFFVIKYSFHDSQKGCTNILCAICCDACDLQSERNDEDWITPGTFGDMYGALTCLFTGWGIIGVIATLMLQYKSFMQQRVEHKYNVAHSEKMYIRDLILHLRNVLKDFLSLPGRKDDSGPVKKLEKKTIHILEQFQYYVDDSNPPDKLECDFREYLENLKLILPIVSQSYYILKELSISENLNDEDINNLTSFLEFNLTPEIKQLLNICFLRFELAENLTAYGSLFNDDIVFSQLKEWGDTIVSETAVRYFMNSIKANQACHKAERIEKNGVRKTVITESLRPIFS